MVKKTRVISLACAVGLLTAYVIVEMFTPRMVVTSPSSLTYANLAHLERKSALILTGKVVQQETQEFIGGENDNHVRDAITKSTVEILTIHKADTINQYRAGDRITVYEPAGIADTGLKDTYFSTDGYQLMRRDSSYILFLSVGVKEGEWIINSYQGKFTTDQNSDTDTEFLWEQEKQKYEQLRKEVITQYKIF